MILNNLKFIFFHATTKKQRKEAGSNLVLFSHSRNMIERFIKNDLHRPIKILQDSSIVMRNGKIVWKVVWIEYYTQHIIQRC